MTTAAVTLADLEMHVDHLDPGRAAAIYREHGALVVRGLMRDYAEQIRQDIEQAAQTAISLLEQAEKRPEGWVTPDGTLFLPAPAGFKRDKQIMVLAAGYYHSAAFLRSAFEPKALDILAQIIGPDIELSHGGQCLYKEPAGGHPKLLHQDSAYFQHKYDGPTAILSYAVPTHFQNGALHVIPGSHRLGVIEHVDTFSHLGLDPKQWTLDRALMIPGEPGDSIFFHVDTIHGSPENHSDGPRPVFIHRYRHPDDYVTIGGSTVANRKLAEKAQNEAKKENQRGLMVRGTRRWNPQRAAQA